MTLLGEAGSRSRANGLELAAIVVGRCSVCVCVCVVIATLSISGGAMCYVGFAWCQRSQILVGAPEAARLRPFHFLPSLPRFHPSLLFFFLYRFLYELLICFALLFIYTIYYTDV